MAENLLPEPRRSGARRQETTVRRDRASRGDGPLRSGEGQAAVGFSPVATRPRKRRTGWPYFPQGPEPGSAVFGATFGLDCPRFGFFAFAVFAAFFSSFASGLGFSFFRPAFFFDFKFHFPVSGRRLDSFLSFRFDRFVFGFFLRPGAFVAFVDGLFFFFAYGGFGFPFRLFLFFDGDDSTLFSPPCMNPDAAGRRDGFGPACVSKCSAYSGAGAAERFRIRFDVGGPALLFLGRDFQSADEFRFRFGKRWRPDSPVAVDAGELLREGDTAALGFLLRHLACKGRRGSRSPQ